MSYLIGLASFAISMCLVLTFHPFESDVANSIFFIGSSILYVILMGIANAREEKFERRIKALEDKLKETHK